MLMNMPQKAKECKCLKCGYVWVPRKKNPRECPDCKSRRWRDEKEINNET